MCLKEHRAEEQSQFRRIRHEFGVMAAYSAFIPCRCSSWCGLLGSQGPLTPPSSPHDLLQPGALCKTRPVMATTTSGFEQSGRDPPLLLSSTHTSIVHKRTGGSCIQTHSHIQTHTHTRSASIVAPLRKPKPELSPHLLLISSRRFCIRKSSREPRVIKENERRAASFFNCDCDH